MSRLLCGAGAALALLSAPLAQADEFDWVYFPMYAGDTAHAVHLKALKFRPDGLLSAAIRYPRVHGDWTGPASEHGWYNYDERLIDCETGYSVATSSALLDHEGRKLATRAVARGDQLRTLGAVLGSARHEWPNGGSDLFLACAAASNTAFQRQRAAAAARVQPQYTNVPLIQVLAEDTAMLRSSAGPFSYDLARAAGKNVSSAADLFHALREQHVSWRRSYNAPYARATPDPAADAALMAAVNGRIADAGVAHLAVKSIKGWQVELDHAREPARMPRYGEKTTVSTVVVSAIADCEYALAMPLAHRTVSETGRVSGVTRLSAKAAQAELRRRNGDDSFMDHDSGLVCRTIGEVQAEARPRTESADGALAYGLTEARLAAQATPEELLLAVRAAWRGAQ